MTSARPTIAVVGTINRDTVRRADGGISMGFGGILYNLRGLAELAIDTTILPVVKIGRDQRRPITSALEKIPNLDDSAIRIVSGKNNHCRLTYHDAGNKTEVLSGWVGAVDRSQLRKALAAEIILVNFISGGDITATQLQWLRKSTPAIIFMDFHSRTLGRRRDGSRFLRIPPDWRNYLSVADFVQMNEVEFELLAETSCDPNHCRLFAKRYLMRKGAVLIVTRGGAGCFVMSRNGQSLECVALEAPRPRRVVDTTGCGDIFSAAFIAHWRRNRDPRSAAAYAAAVAADRAGRENIERVDWHYWRKRLKRSDHK